MVKIEKIDHGSFQEIRGSVDDREVICITNEFKGIWGLVSSVNLPWDIDKAGEILKCFNEAHDQTGI